MKRKSFLFLAFFWFLGCNNDVNKNITTDLQVEGKELFYISHSIEESTYFSFLTLDQYKKSPQLPGCPEVGIDDIAKKITLTFTANTECESRKLKRTGKITLQYFTTNAQENTIVMEYENYTFKTFKIQGKRVFKQLKNFINLNRRTESIENLVITDEFGSSSKLSGNFEYFLVFTGTIFTEFTSSGNLEGRNITGRKITMTPVNIKKYKISCIQNGEVMPYVGSEKWKIIRTEDHSVNHILLYEQDLECKSQVLVNLSDGRNLVLTP